jgi:hypothetical protein
LVVLVLLLFSVGFPGVIMTYLWQNRKELKSLQISEVAGWLYSGYVQGAEAWEPIEIVHRIILTGALLFVPPESSPASYGVLTTVIVIALLNYYQPHKNRLLFWLTQISFTISCAKYVVGLVLKIHTNNEELGEIDTRKQQEAIGIFLILTDAFMLSFSVVSIFIALSVVQKEVKNVTDRRQKLWALAKKKDYGSASDDGHTQKTANTNEKRELRIERRCRARS